MFKRQVLFTTFLISILMVSFLLSGCETLKKKFSRSSKTQEKIEHEPVLDPIDYPDSVYNPLADYTYRFNMLHVWKKEFMGALQDDIQMKRLRYILDNMIIQLEEMDKFIPDSKSADLVKTTEEFKKIRTTLDGPEQFLNKSLVERKVNSMTQDIRSSYQPRDVEAYLINPKL